MSTFIWGQALRWGRISCDEGGNRTIFPESVGAAFCLPGRIESCVNHRCDLMIGRNAAVWSDASGIWFEVEVTNAEGKRAADGIRDRQLRGASFSAACRFVPHTIDGVSVRVVTEILSLTECGPVEYPADTECLVAVSAGSMAPLPSRRNQLFERHQTDRVAAIRSQLSRVRCPMSASRVQSRVVRNIGKARQIVMPPMPRGMIAGHQIAAAAASGVGVEVFGRKLSASAVQNIVTGARNGAFAIV